MTIMFKKDSPRFDRANYDSWKEKMKTHLLCMGPGYWLLTKAMKAIVEESKLEECSECERDLFMCNMRAREAILTSLLENEYNKVKAFQTSHTIRKALEVTFEGDDHAKRMKLKSWICTF